MEIGKKWRDDVYWDNRGSSADGDASQSSYQDRNWTRH